MSRQSTLNVSLTPSLEKYVRNRVKSGGYESASEVVREGLRVLQRQEQATAEYWSEVRAKVAVGRRQLEAGETIDGETAMDEIMAELNDTPVTSKRGRRSR